MAEADNRTGPDAHAGDEADNREGVEPDACAAHRGKIGYRLKRHYKFVRNRLWQLVGDIVSAPATLSGHTPLVLFVDSARGLALADRHSALRDHAALSDSAFFRGLVTAADLWLRDMAPPREELREALTVLAARLRALPGYRAAPLVLIEVAPRNVLGGALGRAMEGALRRAHRSAVSVAQVSGVIA